MKSLLISILSICFGIFPSDTQVDNPILMAKSIVKHNPEPRMLEGGKSTLLKSGYAA